MNKVLSNLHTHTSYCDGKDSPRDMLLSAIAKGFHSLGFSGHGPDAIDFGMDDGVVLMYRRDIEELRKEFEGRIDVFTGLELDSTSDKKPQWLDYSIGSVHILNISGQFFVLDNTAELFADCIHTVFGGDPYALARSYYEQVLSNARNIRPDIIGHLDLITKFNACGQFFDTARPEYIDAAFDAIDALIGLECIIEVNTGSMARGLMTSPYPEKRLLERVHERGGVVMINSDAHSAANIDYAFSEVAELLRSIGFRERIELTKKGFAQVLI